MLRSANLGPRMKLPSAKAPGRLAPAGMLPLPWEWLYPLSSLQLLPCLDRELQSYLAEFMTAMRARVGLCRQEKGCRFFSRFGDEAGEQLPASFEQVLSLCGLCRHRTPQGAGRPGQERGQGGLASPVDLCWVRPFLLLAVRLSRVATPLSPGMPQRLGPDMWAGRLGRAS